MVSHRMIAYHLYRNTSELDDRRVCLVQVNLDTRRCSITAVVVVNIVLWSLQLIYRAQFARYVQWLHQYHLSLK